MAGLALLALAGPACQNAQPSPTASSLTVHTRSAKWSYGGAPGQRIATSHYLIYTTSSNRGLLAYLPGFMEGAYDNYLRLTSLREPAAGTDRMTVYVLADRQQWAIMTERVTGANSRLYLSIENGGYCYRGVCVLWDMGHFATFSIASHEGLHQFFHHRLANGLPAWAEEGLCVLAEGFSLGTRTVSFDPRNNALRITDLRRGISGGRWIPLEKLLAGDAGDHIKNQPDIAAEYYGQLWAMLGFIRADEVYRAGLERMIADAAAGKLRGALGVRPDMGRGRAYVRAIALPAFKRYITKDLAGFEKRLRAYARRLAKLE